MKRRASIGYQQFDELISNHLFYVDKTNFIKEWWIRGDKVTLINRPRRFGKTLTMSMTEHCKGHTLSYHSVFLISKKQFMNRQKIK